jgi:hypothetical protein
MLTAMSRLLLLAVVVVAACHKSAANQASVAAPTAASGQVEHIAVPTGDKPIPAAQPAVDDPKQHLQPNEGTLTVGAAQGTAGSELTAEIQVAPAPGYHVSMEYPVSLTLTPPDGVTLAKAQLSAGGRDGTAGDAAAFSEKGLTFDVKATAQKPGDYQIKGLFKFGVCDENSCHPKKQPITIALAAK